MSVKSDIGISLLTDVLFENFRRGRGINEPYRKIFSSTDHQSASAHNKYWSPASAVFFHTYKNCSSLQNRVIHLRPVPMVSGVCILSIPDTSVNPFGGVVPDTRETRL